ncbi:MAG: apolipoprotein N-acyltransferase [Cellvibrionaceae bacterium]|jgi:apolipoprotein N-acyltransferase
MHPALAILLCFVSGVLTPFGIAPFQISWLSLLGLAGLITGLHSAGSKNRCLIYAFSYGLGYFGIGVSWVFVSIYEHGSSSLPLALALTSIFIVFVAFLFAAPFYGLGFFKEGTLRSLVGIPIIWVFSEWLRTWLLTGFPWLFIGYSQLDNPLVGWAPVGGILFVSLLTVFTASAAAILIQKKTAANIRWLCVITVMIFWVEGSALRGIQWTDSAGEAIKVGVVQPNIPQHLKWDPEFRQPTVEILDALSEELWKLDWIIWPEAAIPETFSAAETFIQSIDQRSKETQTSLFTGVLYDDVEHNKYFNSIIALGEAEGIYHKQRLVPFGEYVPLETWLRGLIAFFNLPTSFISKGGNQQPAIHNGKYRIAGSICYEIAYPNLVAMLAKESHVILTLSNDAWFGKSIGPLQHFHMARMRAIETGRYVVRATNNGVSAIISPTGQVINRSEQFVRTNLTGEIIPMRGNTPYLIWRDYFVLAWLLVGAVFLSKQIIRKSPSTEPVKR